MRAFLLAAAAATLLFAACGGDDEPEPTPSPSPDVTQPAVDSAPLSPGTPGELAGLTITAERLVAAGDAWDVRLTMENTAEADGALPPEFFLACGGAEPVPPVESDARDALDISPDDLIPVGETITGTLRFKTPNPCPSGVFSAQALGAFTGMVGGVPSTLRWALTSE